MDTLRHDLRHGLRLLTRYPGFGLVSVLTLSLGIGANTALFSVVNTALFRPVYADAPEELVSLFNGDRDRRGTSNHAYPDYVDLRDGSADVLTDLAAFTTRPVNLIAGASVERINVGLVTANYFRVLRVKPLAGRDFLPEESVTSGAHPVAIISEGLWRRQFGTVTGLANQQVWLNNKAYAVVGVVPDAVSRMVIVVKVDVFVPAMMQGAIRGGRDYLSDQAIALQGIKGSHACRERRSRVGCVKLIERDALDAERPPAGFAGGEQMSCPAVRNPCALRACQATLGCHGDTRTIAAPAAERAGDQPLVVPASLASRQ